MATANEGFKASLLQDLRLQRNLIDHFLNDTFTAAELAVEDLFSNQGASDALEKLDELNTLLKICRERFAQVGNIVASFKPIVLPSKKTQASIPLELMQHDFKLSISTAHVSFGKPFAVELLSPGSPASFWLKLTSDSVDKIEKDLGLFYSSVPVASNLPSIGSYVVCLHDAKFCRGKVANILNIKKSPKVEIVLVDYGSLVTVSVDQIYAIQQQFCSQPAIGLFCSFYRLEPPNQAWDIGSIGFFLQQCQSSHLFATFHLIKEEESRGETFISQHCADFSVSLESREPGEAVVDIGLCMAQQGLAMSSNNLVNVSPSVSLPMESIAISSSHLSSSISEGNTSNHIPKLLCRSSASASIKMNDSQAIGGAATSTTDFNSFESSGHTEPLIMNRVMNKPSQSHLNSQFLVGNGSHQSSASFKSNSKISESQMNLKQSETSQKTASSSAARQELKTNAPDLIPLHSSQNTSEQSFKSPIMEPVNGKPESNPTSNSEAAHTSKHSNKTSTSGLANQRLTRSRFSAIPPKHLEADLLNDPAVREQVAVYLAHQSETGKSMDKSHPGMTHSDYSSSVNIAIDLPVNKPGDPVLMEKFLKSLEMPLRKKSTGDNDSFFTSSSRNSSHSSVCSVAAWQLDPSNPSFKLDYQFGAVLKKRISPFCDNNSSSKTIKFLFSYVFSPSYFYVHLSEEVATRVEPLIHRLNVLYENSLPVPVTQPEIGSFWVIKEVGRNVWSRVEVTDVNYEQQTVSVFFVDWGDMEIVDICELRPLVKELLDIPCLAFCCRLGGIYPYSKSMVCPDWPKKAIEKFVSLCNPDSEMTALVSPCVEEKGTLSIILFFNGDENNYSVNELLVRLQLASSDVFNFNYDMANNNENDNEPLTRVMPEWNPMAEDFYSAANTAVLDTENYDSVTTGYIPKDEERICRFFRASGTCYKGMKCEQLHCNPTYPSATQDTMEVYVDVPELPSPTPGMYLSIQVTVVANSFRFYCVLPHGMKNLECAFTDDDDENLETMQIAMQREYSTNYHQHRISLNPSAGDIVIAKSPVDNMWYRGRVMQEEENEEFTIFYVDFGNLELVHMRNLCTMLPRFNHLPAQAVEMFLNGVEMNETIEGRDLLVRLVKNKDLVARVIHTSPYLSVDLYDTQGQDEVDIAQELISRGVVQAGNRKKFCMQSRGKVIPG